MMNKSQPVAVVIPSFETTEDVDDDELPSYASGQVPVTRLPFGSTHSQTGQGLAQSGFPAGGVYDVFERELYNGQSSDSVGQSQAKSGEEALPYEPYVSSHVGDRIRDPGVFDD